VFTESSNRLATIARKAKALTVSKIGGRNKPIVSLVQAFLVKVAHGNRSGPAFSARQPTTGAARRKNDMSELNVGTQETGGASRGFTLIELMIAVAVVAILTMIAIPTYSNQMIKGRRSAAEAVLLDLAQRQQQYLLDARAYAPDVPTLLGTTTLAANVSAYYTVNFAPPVAGPPNFKAQAIPLAGTAQAGDVTLTIDNNGVKTPAGTW
jgi:type IV pilus assembly protein PilE